MSTSSANAAVPVVAEHAWYERGVSAPVAAGTFLPLDPFRMSFGLMSGAAWLDRASAGQNHIGTAGATFYLTTGLVLFDVLSVSGSFGAVFPADHASFTEDVMPLLGGSTMTAESSLEIHNYSFVVGPRTPLLVLRPGPAGAVAAALFAEYGWSRINGQRGISNCSNCLTKDFGMVDGTFWAAGVEVLAIGWAGVVESGLTVPISYARYSTGAGITQEIRAGFTISFF